MHRFVLAFVSAASLLLVSGAEAATYYVRGGGNDSADGRSHGTAWASLTKVGKQVFAAGDVVLLHEGDRWVGSLAVDWAGTTTQPAVLGAYYVAPDGTLTRGYKSARPIIDGTGTLPGSRYDALVRVRSPRVRVENLKIMNSTGRSIDVADVAGVTIIGCATDNTSSAAIHVLRSQGTTIENNYVTHAGTGGTPWGSAIEMESSSGSKARSNIVTEVYGEGINAHGGSTDTLIENNYVFAARAVGIYSDAAPDTTIRRNIVVGTTNAEYWRSTRTVGAGIALNNEKYHYEGTNPLALTVQTQRAKVYGNLVAFTSSGIALWGELAQTSFDGTIIFNNTLVDNDTQLTLQSGRPRPSSRFVNNILLSLSSGTRDVSGTDLGGMSANSNYFSQGNPGGGFAQSSNRYSGLQIQRMAGWRAVNDRSQITWRDFLVKDGSSVISAGDDEPRRMAQGNDSYQLDYNAADHNAPMDMGAVRFTSLAAKLPSPPEGLALVE